MVVSVSLRDEYRAKFGNTEGDRLYLAVQNAIDDGMNEAVHIDWWRMIARERAAGEMFVAKLLDALCYELGFDPVEVWRRPRQAEIDDEERRRRWALDAYSRMSFTITPPVGGSIIDITI